MSLIRRILSRVRKPTDKGRFGRMLLQPNIAGERSWTSFAILTNGTLINDKRARRLANLQVSYVQVSIEGMQATHDQIRGKGNFHLTVEAVKHLVRAGIRTVISFTAHQGNYREFAAVAKLGCSLQRHRVYGRIGSGGITKDNIAILMPFPFYCFVILVEAIHIVIIFLKQTHKSLNYRLENIDVLSLERK